MKFLMDRFQRFSITLILLFSLGLLSACGGGGSTVASTSSNTSVADGAGVSPSQTGSSYTGSSADVDSDQAAPSYPDDGSGGGSNDASLPDLGDITLSWVPPSTRADGSPLAVSEISAYRIYYTTKSGSYTKYVSVDGSDSKITIDGLPLGQYYLTMTTVDVDGLESDFSPEVSIII